MPCTKCGIGRFQGPRYVRNDSTGEESLQYTCTTCGYLRIEPTHEQRQAAQQQEILMRYARMQHAASMNANPFAGADKPMKDITPRSKQIEKK